MFISKVSKLWNMLIWKLCITSVITTAGFSPEVFVSWTVLAQVMNLFIPVMNL